MVKYLLVAVVVLGIGDAALNKARILRWMVAGASHGAESLSHFGASLTGSTPQ